MSDEVFCANCGKHLCTGTPCSMRLHADGRVRAAVNPEPLSAADNQRKRLKLPFFFFILLLSFLEDIISTWAAEAVNFSLTPNPPPPPSSYLQPPPVLTSLSSQTLSGGKSADFLCLNGLAKDNFICIWKEGRRRRRGKPIHFFLCPVCTTTLKWLQCYCALFLERWFKYKFSLNENCFFFFFVPMCLVRN